MGITMVEIASHTFFNLEEGALKISLINEGDRGYAVLSERTDRHGDVLSSKKTYFAALDAAQTAYNEATSR